MAHRSPIRRPYRTPAALLFALLLVLLLPFPPHTQAAPPAAGTPLDAAPRSAPGAWSGYRLLEVTYLLRAPDGSLVRVTRQPPGSASAWSPAAPLPGADAAAVEPVLGLQGWLGGWLFRSPRIYSELSDYVRESWAVILRLLDYLGVVVLIAGSWVVWFLVRPALLGVPDRTAFLLVFAVASGLWLYVTQLYASVVYALGLMLLPALVLALAGWLVRRLWGALGGAT